MNLAKIWLGKKRGLVGLVALTLLFFSTISPCLAQEIPVSAQPNPSLMASQHLAQRGLLTPSALEAFLEKFFTQQMKKRHIPGAVFVLVKDGNIFLDKGYGFADLEHQIPVIPEKTLFRVGSVSKIFTATAVMQLAEQGKLKLDDDINQHLKNFQVKSNYFQPITFANLLTHTDGFDSGWGIGSFSRSRSKMTPLATGASGDVRVNTNLLVMDEGIISVANKGLGNAGELIVNASSILLSNSSVISARTLSGEGGNIAIFSKDLQLRDNSEITTTAIKFGNGGNLTINLDTLVALENSRITANAFEGQGGAVQIKAQGFFLSLDSDVTASSELGIDGTVEINSLATLERFNSQPTERFASLEEAIAQSCLAHTGEAKGTFVYTGTGGLPINPDSGIDSGQDVIEIPRPPQSFVSPPEAEESQESQTSETSPLASTRKAASDSESEEFVVVRRESTNWKIGDPIVEPTLSIKTKDGRILLVAAPFPEKPFEVLDLVCQ